MSVLNMAKNIKEVHPEFVVLYKVGSFYHAYGKDAYIMSYLFSYQMKIKKDNIYEIGFPQNTISRITAKLQNEKINYMLIDTRNNYDVDEKFDNNNVNTYLENFDKSFKYIRLKRRIERISEALILEINSEKIKEKIRKIEEIIDEN